MHSRKGDKQQIMEGGSTGQIKKVRDEHETLDTQQSARRFPVNKQRPSAGRDERRTEGKQHLRKYFQKYDSFSQNDFPVE